MSNVPNVEVAPELPEFLSERARRVYSFLWYCVPDKNEIETLLTRVFRKFSEKYRREVRKKGFVWEPMELELQLFSMAWRFVREADSPWTTKYFSNRDQGKVQDSETNLLAQPAPLAAEPLREEVTRRLGLLDIDYRAPIVLCDILGFNDEEALRVLGLRWGVFRHRLHRGRLDFGELLEGEARGY